MLTKEQQISALLNLIDKINSNKQTNEEWLEENGLTPEMMLVIMQAWDKISVEYISKGRHMHEAMSFAVLDIFMVAWDMSRVFLAEEQK